MFTLTARLASVSWNSEAVSQSGHEAVIEAEGGSVLPQVTGRRNGNTKYYQIINHFFDNINI